MSRVSIASHAADGTALRLLNPEIRPHQRWQVAVRQRHEESAELWDAPSMPYFLVICAIALAACGPVEPSGPLHVEAEGHEVREGDRDLVEVTARTEPGATVAVHGERGLLGPAVKAGPDGRATFRFPDEDEFQYKVVAFRGHDEAWLQLKIEHTVKLRGEENAPEFVSCRGGGGVPCHLYIDHLGNVTLTESPEGTVIESGGRRAVVSERETLLTVDLDAAIGSVDLDELFTGTDHRRIASVPITLRFPDGREAHGDLPLSRLSTIDAISEHFKRATTGGVDTAVAATGTALVVAGFDMSPRAVLVGNASRLSDVRWVAAVEIHSRQLGSCGMYTNGDGEREEVLRATNDLTIRIVDRQSGAPIGAHTFRGPTPRCGPINFGGIEIGAQRKKAALAWIRQQHARLSGAPR